MTSGLIAFWLVLAAAFSAFSSFEAAGLGEGRWTMWRLLGLLGCVLWPLALPLFIVFALVHARHAKANARRGLRPQLISRV